MKAITLVAEGDIFLDAPLAEKLRNQLKLLQMDASKLLEYPHLLTKREWQIIRLVAKSSSNKEIAKNLSVSERTIKAHLHSAMQKLGARDRLHAVTLAGRLTAPENK